MDPVAAQYNRLVAGDRSSTTSILGEVLNCSNTLLIHGGHSAYMVLGSNPVESYSWQDGVDDLQFAQEASISGNFAQQWKLRMVAQ